VFEDSPQRGGHPERTEVDRTVRLSSEGCEGLGRKAQGPSLGDCGPETPAQPHWPAGLASLSAAFLLE
jgi:hypothetical protein